MLLSLEHVGKTNYVGPYEKRVLVDVSLSIEPGQFVGVWGAQRSGKSTLLRIAAGVEAPDTGTVSFDGRDLRSLPSAERAHLRLGEIGLVQAERPPSDAFDVLTYVSLPLRERCKPREAESRALAALRRVGVAECRNAYWDQLSDGEKALVNLAHGLGREPRLLLVDDPTVGLDTLQQREVVELLCSVVAEQDIAVLMTSSVLASITDADIAYTLSDGALMPVADYTGPGAKVLQFRTGEEQTG